MATYALVRYRITDEARFERYRELAGPTTTSHGGKLVAKGAETRQLEGGDELTNFVLLKFPSAEAVDAWYDSDEYGAAKQARADAATMTISVMES
ncbi:MAG: DUF1330 domain-containing protein [Acidobacteria bacterium]|nr:DUF1330 domain-containing protein [Acidobacteriota bacterium]